MNSRSIGWDLRSRNRWCDFSKPRSIWPKRGLGSPLMEVRRSDLGAAMSAGAVLVAVMIVVFCSGVGGKTRGLGRGGGLGEGHNRAEAQQQQGRIERPKPDSMRA